MRSRRGWLQGLAAGCALMLGMPAAVAAGLSVSPVSLQFAPQDAVQGLWLTNSGDQTLRAQLRVFAWTQDRDGDRLEPSTALVASPPMLSIEPGQKQFVRIVRPATAPAERELSFRLLIDELPDPAQPARPGLNFVMRYSVPVFVGSPPQTAVPLAAPSWSLQREQTSSRRLLSLRNPAPHRVQVADLELVDARGEVLYRHAGLLGYVLAGGTRDWPLTLPSQATSETLEIRVRLNGERVRQPLPAQGMVGAPR